MALMIKLPPSAGCTRATALLFNYLNASVPASNPSLLKVPLPTSQTSFPLPSTPSEKGIKELTPTIQAFFRTHPALLDGRPAQWLVPLLPFEINILNIISG